MIFRQLRRRSHLAYARSYYSFCLLREAAASRGTQGHTKAVVVEAKSRKVPPTIRRPALASSGVPAAAPEYPIRAPTRPPRIDQRTRWIITVPILTPLPNVSVHVVQTKSVRLFQTNRMSGFSAVPTKPSVITQLTYRVTITIARRSSSATRKLPFSFRR